MTRTSNQKTNRLFDRDLLDSQTDSQENLSFPSDDKKYSINENITSLDELQTLSDLASQLQNASGRKGKHLTEILNESQTLLINGLTDNLNDSEKSEAVELISNIITMNPHPQKLFLEYNHFYGQDLEKIIAAVIEAKANNLLDTQLNELHLRGSIETQDFDVIAPKLIVLKNRYALRIDLDHDIQLLLSKKEEAIVKKPSAKSKTRATLFDQSPAAADDTTATEQKKPKP